MTDGLRLLLIDDDEDSYVLVRDFLAETASGWIVDWAPTYERGLAELGSRRYDAALLDFHLGARTGVELLAAVKDRESMPPIVLLTGQGDRETDLTAMAMGAASYLEKSALSPVLLERTVRFALERDRTLAALRASEASYRGLFERAGDAVLIADDEGRYVDANPAACALFGEPRENIIGRSLTDFVVGGADVPDARGAWSAFLAAGEMSGRVRIRRPDGVIREAGFRATANFMPGRHLSILRDETERAAAEAAQARLIGAIDQAAETIIVTDAAARVVYANPAIEASTGDAVADLVGRDLWTSLRWAGSASSRRRIAERLQSGRSWSGELALLRADGVFYREEVTISPVRDADGATAGLVYVGRDVSHLRQIQKSLDLAARERVAFAHALARLEQRPTPEETGQDLADALAELAGVEIATVLAFEQPDTVRILGLTAPSAYPLRVGDALPAARAAYLRGRSADGAWSEPFVERDEDGAYGDALSRLGLRAMAGATVSGPDGPVGLIAVATTDKEAALRWSDQIPAVSEFAAAARGLLGGPLAARNRLRESANEIRRIIDDGAFDPVFQPIVDLETRFAIGYEALTRFHDGRRPDHAFAMAATCGVGLELESATLERAIDASSSLPAGPWLALNVSAAMILDGDRLATTLQRRTRPIVLEITEHDAIDDYGTLRNAVASLGPDVRTAVDDAGAGVANFTHIVELRPDFVKVDASLVHGVNHDLERQALIVGLHHFAQATNGWVIAEGVETEEERQTLMGLEIQLAQGYLFGSPDQVETWPSPASRRLPDGSADADAIGPAIPARVPAIAAARPLLPAVPGLVRVG